MIGAAERTAIDWDEPHLAPPSGLLPPSRYLLFFLPALALVASGIVVGVAVGATNIGIGDVLTAFLDRTHSPTRTIVWDIRLPRVLIAALVGLSLGIAGGLLQSVTRNPLGDPHILGLSAGGGLASVITLRIAADFPRQALPPIAFAGCLVGAAIVYGVAWRAGVSPLRLALAGVAVASLFTAGTTAVLVTSKLMTQGAMAWLAGGLYARGWADLEAFWPYAIIGAVGALAMAPALNILALGDETARSLGLSVERTRLGATTLAAVLTAGAVSVAGIVGFVGLVMPHLARLLTRSDDQRFVLPLSGLFGAALVIYADIAARLIQRPLEVPMGIVTAALGVPFFLWLIRSRA